MAAKEIAQNFDLGAKFYDENADLQWLCANNLAEIAGSYLKNGDDVVDLGSGTGFVGRALGFEVVEVDFSLQMLRASDQENGVCACVEELPFADNCFDGVVSSFALQWVADFEALLGEVRRVLKGRGYFIFSLPVFGSLQGLRRANLESGADFLILDLPKFEDILPKIEKFMTVEEIFSRKIIKKHENGVAALRKIKKIGAKHYLRNKKPLNRKKIEKFNDFFLKECNNEVNWEIKYFICHV